MYGHSKLENIKNYIEYNEYGTPRKIGDFVSENII